MVFGEPTQPCMLWERFKDSMSEDLLKEAKAYLQLPTDEWKQCAENGSPVINTRRTRVC